MTVEKLTESTDAKTAKAARELIEYGIARTSLKRVAKAIEDAGAQLWICNYGGWATYELRYGGCEINYGVC